LLRFAQQASLCHFLTTVPERESWRRLSVAACS
jgi:hypothetical protein